MTCRLSKSAEMLLKSPSYPKSIAWPAGERSVCLSKRFSPLLRNRTKYAYDSLGRKTRTVVGELASPVSETQYRYDSLGRLEYVDVVERNNVLVDSNSSLAGNQPESTRYRYDLQGSLDRTDLANGVVADYTYDSLNRLTQLVNYAPDSTPENLANNSKLAQYDYELRADGRKESAVEKFWVEHESETVEITNEISWTYDGANRLIDEVFITDADDILGLQSGLIGDSRQWADYKDTYTYDLTGNRLQKTTDEENDESIDRIIDSTYDVNDRLLTETDTVGLDVTETEYEYDHTQQTEKTVEFNSALKSTTQFTWDVMGRLKVATVTAYTSGVASKIEKTTYGYDAQGIRVSALAETDANADSTFETHVLTKFLNDKQNHTGYSQVLRQVHIDAATDDILKVVDYAIGHDQISQTTTEYVDGVPGTQIIQWFGTDGHGSVRMLFDLAGAIATVAGFQQIYHFDAYGIAIGFNPSQAATTYLYSGEQFDTHIEMQYLRARYYQPASGRFAGLDPYVGDQFDPQSLHKYLYTHADPLNNIDPSGQASLSVGMAISIGIGALLAVTVLNATGFIGTPSARPSLAEGLVPFWGSGKAFLYDLNNGHFISAGIDAAFFVTDMFLIRSVVTGVGKLGWREIFKPGVFTMMFGKHNWSNTFHAAWQIGDNFFHAVGNTGGKNWIVRTFTKENLLKVLPETSESLFVQFTKQLGIPLPVLSKGLALSTTCQPSVTCIHAMLASFNAGNLGVFERVVKATILESLGIDLDQQ